MSTITRRYSWQGPDLQDLANSTDPTLTLTVPSYRLYVDVMFNDANSDVESMDTQMQKYGLVPASEDTIDPSNGSTIPFVGLVSPDGSVWEIQVDDSGALSAVKRSP